MGSQTWQANLVGCSYCRGNANRGTYMVLLVHRFDSLACILVCSLVCLIPAHCGKQSKCTRSKIKQRCTLHNAGMRDDKKFFWNVLWWYKSAIGGFFCTVGRGYLLPRQLLSCSSNKCWYAIASQRFFLFARNLNFYWKLWANFIQS